jgi:HCOMODA/2-hydroxy-3-carboxy-muconic semialdehyde decarboxylase
MNALHENAGNFGEVDPVMQRRVRVAARALARSGLVHAYGHCSVRLNTRHFLVCAAKPMGTITPGEAGTIVPIVGALPEGVLGEVRIHQAIYQRRPAIGAICRIMPPQTMLLSLMRRTPRPRHGFGAYFAPGPPLWEDPRLLRDDDNAGRLADMLGNAPAVVMRANGAVVVGADLVEALALSWFLEEAARVETALVNLRADGEETLLTAEETVARQVTAGGVYKRMWQYLTHGDPECFPVENCI